MPQTTKHGWTILDEDAGVWSYSYTFGPEATATSFAVRHSENRVAVISPPCRVEDGVFDDIRELGEVTQLVSNNGFHHLGLPEWQRAFPESKIYAEATGAKRIRAKNKSVGELHDISELQASLGDNVSVSVAETTKCGETWTHAATKDGNIWFTSDVLSNLEALPPKFFFRMFFKLTGTKPGFGVFNTAVKFTIRDRRAALSQLRAAMKEHGPTLIVPAHGGIVQGNDVAERAIGLLNRELT